MTQRANEIHIDRRRFPRVAAPGVVSHFQTRDVGLAGLTVDNLSEGGMFVRTPSPLPAGTRGMVQIVGAGLRLPIFGLGYVAFVISPGEARRRGVVAGMGVRVDPVDLDATRRLCDLVADLAAAADPVPALRREEAEDVEAEGPRTRPSAPSPIPEPRAVDPGPAPVDTSAEDAAARNRLIQQLEEEIVVLRAELVQRNRSIGDLTARLAASEAAAQKAALRPTRVVPVDEGGFARRGPVDPRAE